MSRPTLRAFAISGIAAATIAAPTAAFASGHSHSHSHGDRVRSSHSSHHGKKAHRHFTATGVVTAVDTSAGTVTIADKGGSKDLHGQSVTVVVSATTKVSRNDAPASLADLQAGDHVAANGLRGSDGSLNAKHVNACNAAAAGESPEPTESPSPTTTESPTPTPTDTASAAPTK